MYNKILILDGDFPYEEEKLRNILTKYAKHWIVRTESVQNTSVNLIIEIRGVKKSSEMIAEIRELKCFHDVSLMIQEGSVN